MSLTDAVLAGDLLALARLLTQVENNTPAGCQALEELFPHGGKAHLVGITGSTGTGKSSLVNRLALNYRKPAHGDPRRVAVLAVDPSSPFTGGAVLGDRVRMGDLAGDAGVFIRSMASRGSLGGLAQATADMVQVFDAAGFDVVLIETVGAGQSEVEIARLAHTTLVVEAPGLGDDIQAIKAGILEIADILVVNKADQPGAERAERALKTMLSLAHPVKKDFHHGLAVGPVRGVEEKNIPAWEPPVLLTVATEGAGVSELAVEIDRHARYLHESGGWELRERARLEVELEALVKSELAARFHSTVTDDHFGRVVDRLTRREISPRAAVDLLLK